MTLTAALPADTLHPLADAVRVTLLVLTILLGLLVLRFALVRITRPEGDAHRESSGWGLLSYAAFIGISVYDGFQRFGLPLSPVRVTMQVVALIGGFIGGFLSRHSIARLRTPRGGL